MTDREHKTHAHRPEPPREFDRKSCMAVLAVLVCFWIAAAGGLWACFGGLIGGVR